MKTSNPITPPPELVEQWFNDSPLDRGLTLATRAAQWGADQELEACCEWLNGWQENKYPGGIENLRAARRPKPPSLKEQALEWLIAAEKLHKVSGIDPEGIIRRALEALPND
jgi:hypothetical protein